MNRQMRRAASRQQGKRSPQGTTQAQEPMAMLQKVQDDLETMNVEGTAGGGVVKIIMTGKQIVESVKIDPDAVEDVEMLQDLVVAAINDAMNKSQDLASEKLSVITGGLDIPGLG